MKTLQQEIVEVLRELDLFTSVSSSCAARDISLKLKVLIEKVESARCRNCNHWVADYLGDSATGECFFADGTNSKNFGCWHFEQKVK